MTSCLLFPPSWTKLLQAPGLPAQIQPLADARTRKADQYLRTPNLCAIGALCSCGFQIVPNPMMLQKYSTVALPVCHRYTFYYPFTVRAPFPRAWLIVNTLKSKFSRCQPQYRVLSPTKAHMRTRGGKQEIEQTSPYSLLGLKGLGLWPHFMC